MTLKNFSLLSGILFSLVLLNGCSHQDSTEQPEQKDEAKENMVVDSPEAAE